jgi:hypothetical protein
MHRILLALACLCPKIILAGSFIFEFSRSSVTPDEDPFYLAQYGQASISKVYTTSAEYELSENNFTRVTATMFGRGFDGDPNQGDDWGILDTQDPRFTEAPSIFSGFILKYGMQPRSVGSRDSLFTRSDGTPVPASYIGFSLLAGTTVMFDEISIRMADMVAIQSTNVAWAEIVGFDEVVVPAIEETEAGRTLTFAFPNTTITNIATEVRIYGIKGADYGNFSLGAITGQIDPVPEPGMGILTLLGGAGLALRRRRI